MMDSATRSNGTSEIKKTPKDTICRNIQIYGKCRYEDKGCVYNHNVEQPKPTLTNGNGVDSPSRRTLNVDSPSFTPTFLSPNINAPPKKPLGLSPKAASAKPFMPQAIISRSSSATPVRQDARTPDWVVPEVQDFVPRRIDASFASESGASAHSSFEPFQPPPAPQQYMDPTISGPSFYQNSSAFHQPVQYHLYAPIDHTPTNLLPYQRTVHDLFIANDFREEIQKRNAAALQTLPHSQLPAQIEGYHSLVPLDTQHHKGSSVLGGYTSWIYKAQSANGRVYALRRIEGFRLHNDLPTRAFKPWEHIDCASIVRVHQVFSSRLFGDSSLIFVTDYHPLAKTLAEHHQIGLSRQLRTRASIDQVSETVMWSYVCQIASALKTIHSNGLAARLVDFTKIVVTDKNRIRLNACGMLDVVQHENPQPLTALQRQDLYQFGLVIISLGANVPDASQNFARAMDAFKRYYKPELQNAVIWLYSALNSKDKTIDQFIAMISGQMITSFNGALHHDDRLYDALYREVENGRLFRLVTKLNFINERPEFEHNRQWSENGERYFLKLFRDYVFHQVDAQNRPVVDLGHVLTCLNKLDAGTDERVTLISRDEQHCFIVSYRELKKGIESAFQELVKSGRKMH